MTVTVQASTGVQILVWRDGSLFHARRAGTVSEPQVCLALDLFEVIADLAGLDLERSNHSREAIELASVVQTSLASA
jgi:hypothetical protein